MQDLGNLKIATTGRGVKIKHPEAAADLLDLALEAAKDRRRLIFYCACQFPRWKGKLSCHRDTVTDLLLAEAKKRHRSIRIVEWPGGEPARAHLSVDRKLFSSIMNGRWSVPIDADKLRVFAGLPWGSILTLECDATKEREFVAVGPPMFSRGWSLQVSWQAAAGKTKGELARDIRQWRRDTGLDERRAG